MTDAKTDDTANAAKAASAAEAAKAAEATKAADAAKAKEAKDTADAAEAEAARKDREAREQADREAAVIVGRSPDDITLNSTPREAQIAQANEHMRRVSENPEHSAIIEKQADDETAVYEKLADAAPTAGRARDENTPVRISKDGTRHWA